MTDFQYKRVHSYWKASVFSSHYTISAAARENICFLITATHVEYNAIFSQGFVPVGLNLAKIYILTEQELTDNNFADVTTTIVINACASLRKGMKVYRTSLSFNSINFYLRKAVLSLSSHSLE